MNTANLYGTDMFIGTRVMNYKNVAGLSDSEFGEFYLGNMKDYDFFLQRSFFSKPPKTVKKFSDVNYVSGYGFIVKKQKRKIMKILNNTDWRKHCTLTVHNVSHLSMYHIRNALAEGVLKPSKSQKNIHAWF